jgi:dihydrofolate reductase
MTSFIYNTSTSVNGFIADADGSLGWLFEVEGDAVPSMELFMQGVGVQVMGSTTYSWLLEHENLIEEPEKWSAYFGSMATQVFSSRGLPVPEGADVEIVWGAVSDCVDRIVARAHGKDVWIVGGGDLAGQFLDAGYLDRIELAVAPAFIPSGAPLLPRALSSARLRLVEVDRVGPFARLVYDVIR